MDEKILTMQLGKVIERLRQQEGLSQEKLGLMTGISRQYLIKIEHGMANPTVELLNRLAAGLGISVSRIMSEAEPNGLESLPPGMHPKSRAKDRQQAMPPHIAARHARYQTHQTHPAAASALSATKRMQPAPSSSVTSAPAAPNSIDAP